MSPNNVLSAKGTFDLASDDPEWFATSRGFLSNPNLAILAGSGCSYGLRGSGNTTAPMMTDLLTTVRDLPTYADLLARRPEFSAIENVEELLSATQSAASLSPDSSVEEAFIATSTEAIRAACDFVDADTDLTHHETLIRKLANRDPRHGRLEIFTTNYDLAFETALQNIRFTAIDGFGYGSRARFSGANFEQDIVLRGPRGELELAPNVVRLLKLHGSVDWDETPHGIRRTATPANPVLIYPSSNKYQQSYRQPYMEAVARLQATLRRQNTTVLVIGFGFNDDHLTQPLVDALMGEPTLQFVVVSPEALTGATRTLTRLRDAVSAGDNRITLVAATLADIAKGIPERSNADPWQVKQEELAQIWSQP